MTDNQVVSTMFDFNTSNHMSRYVLRDDGNEYFGSHHLSPGVHYLGWLSFMSTLEEILVANSGSTKVWVMDPSLLDG
jgi:hypothetical protein